MKRIFIVGAPRSGTTLLQGMLYAGGDIYSMPETHFFRRGIGTNYYGFFKGANFRYKSTLGGFKEKIKSVFSSEYYISKKVNDIDKASFLLNKKIWIEKTPDHVFYINEIKALYPETIFIFISRDCKEVVPSICDMWHTINNKKSFHKRCISSIHNLYVFLQFYKSENEIKLKDISTDLWLFRAVSHVNKTNKFYIENKRSFVSVDFKSVTENTEKTLIELSETLGIKYSQDMLFFGKTSNDLIEKEEVWKSNNKIGKIVKNGGKYEALSKREQYILDVLLGG